MSLSAGWNAQGGIDAPSAFKTASDHFTADAKLSGPVCQYQAPTLKYQPDVTATVSHLVAAIGPAAVILRIGAIIVDAFERLALWPLAHVAKELRETVSPFLGHRDASLAVISVVQVVRIVASSLRGLPRRIFTRLVSAMRYEDRRGHFVAPAITALTNAPGQAVAFDNPNNAAIASASPVKLAVLANRPVDDKPSRKAQSVQVLGRWRHGLVYA